MNNEIQFNEIKVGDVIKAIAFGNSQRRQYVVTAIRNTTDEYVRLEVQGQIISVVIWNDEKVELIANRPIIRQNEIVLDSVGA
jgi:adenine-specific DNA methylase